MKIKDYIFIIIYFIAFCIALIGKDTWISIIGISIIYICFISEFMYNILKWNKNKKQITYEYVKLRIENSLYEFFMLFALYFSINREYERRIFYLKYIQNKIVEITNFKDFLNTYDGIEKIILFMLIGFPIGLILLIIKKIVCRGRISSDQILFSSGELIDLKDIKDVKIENSFWGFSQKISLTLDRGCRVFYIKNTSFTKIEESLCSLGNNK